MDFSSFAGLWRLERVKGCGNRHLPDSFPDLRIVFLAFLIDFGPDGFPFVVWKVVMGCFVEGRGCDGRLVKSMNSLGQPYPSDFFFE